MAVNKFRSSKNPEVVNLVKRMIKSWKDEVKKSKLLLKKPSSPAPSSSNDEKLKSASVGAGASVSASGAAGGVSDGKAAKSTYNGAAKGGLRTFRTDGIDCAAYDNKTRNGALQALYNGLAKDNNTVSSKEIFDIVKEIETAVYNLARYETSDTYRNKLRSLVMNIKSANNPELRSNILSRNILAHRLVKMSPEEMVNENLKKEREQIEKENLFKAKSAVEKRAITDSFICGKCKQRKVTYYQMQTRSADEPLTTFCTCVNCGNHWTFS